MFGRNSPKNGPTTNQIDHCDPILPNQKAKKGIWLLKYLGLPGLGFFFFIDIELGEEEAQK